MPYAEALIFMLDLRDMEQLVMLSTSQAPLLTVMGRDEAWFKPCGALAGVLWM